MKRLIIAAALVASLSACDYGPPPDTRIENTQEGQPFLELWLDDLQNPPTSVPKQPEFWYDLMLPPEEMP
ncbi:hypothetical protein MYRNA_53 [Mycobacterium phage Myrna]|uniref:Lipoprotein n=1 Tax=Mycobacterium phage Myrna TaxID=546805 RepID=B5LJ64_9CAUD|nr:gp53 [Mycobacterium phage Myrna]ACH62061.1 hypothetical protein MYRNA_53 [Mycobacterium phage Myrna]